MKKILTLIILILIINIFAISEEEIIKNLEIEVPEYFVPEYPGIEMPNALLDSTKINKKLTEFSFSGKVGWNLLNLEANYSTPKLPNYFFNSSIYYSRIKNGWNNFRTNFSSYKRAGNREYKLSLEYLRNEFSLAKNENSVFSTDLIFDFFRYSYYEKAIIRFGSEHFDTISGKKYHDLKLSLEFADEFFSFKSGLFKEDIFFETNIDFNSKFKFLHPYLNYTNDGFVISNKIFYGFEVPALGKVHFYNNPQMETSSRKEVWLQNQFSNPNYDKHFTRIPIDVGFIRLHENYLGDTKIGAAWKLDDLFWISIPKQPYQLVYNNSLQFYAQDLIQFDYRNWTFKAKSEIQYTYGLEDWKEIRPFSYILNENLKVNQEFEEFNVNLDLDFGFLGKDSDNKDLPMKFGVNVSIEKLWNHIFWQAGVNNLFGSKTATFKQIPTGRATVFVGFRVL